MMRAQRNDNERFARRTTARWMGERLRSVRRCRPSNVLLLCAFICLVASSAYAEEGLSTMRSAGMGDNNVATATSNGAIFNNPAGLAGASLYSLEAGYGGDFRSRTHSLVLSVADSKTNEAIAGGFAYTFSFAQDGSEPFEERKRDHDIRVAGALPIVPQRLSIGVSGRYLNYKHGEDAQRRDPNGFTMDAGLMAKLTEQVFFGFVAKDLIYIRDATGRRKLRAGLGAFFGPVQFNAQWGVGIDRKQEETAQHRFGGGAEVNLDGLMLRVGFQHHFWNNDNVLSVGAGFRSDGFGLDAVYRQHFDIREQREFGFSFLVFL